MGRLSVLFLLTASFFEGGALMAFEILSSKLYTPFIGASMYVWSSILTITLVGLAIGYKIGGALTKKENIRKKLIISFLVSGGFILFSPSLSTMFLPFCLDFEIEVASIISGIVILLIPVFFLGTISPMIVKEVFEYNKIASKATGIVYGVGTLGGILFLLLTAFVLIPAIGVRSSIYLTGGLLVLTGLLLFVQNKTSKNG